MIMSTSSATTLVGYVNGQPYYGSYHAMANGNLMTGTNHTVDSLPITSTPTSPIDSSSTPVSSTSSTSSTSSSSSSTTSSGY